MFEFLVELLFLTVHVSGLIYRELRQQVLDLAKSKKNYSSSYRNGPSHQGSTRLSNPIEGLKASYDVVIIGSGYGAGVAASRMARASPKQSICVLERGLERWPGEYPNSLSKVIPNLRFTGHFKTLFRSFSFDVGSKTGLYHWIIGKASRVFVGNGLGGTSLLNAGVFLRPTSEVLEANEWPAEVRQDGSLDEYFKRAKDMLEPRTYPENFPPLRKYEVLRKQAKAVGLDGHFSSAPIMTAFSTCETAAGVKLCASTLSSQDSLGPNDGSKNTVLTSYLADAWNCGAEIYCGCEAQYVLKNPGGGYNIYYRDLSQLSRVKLFWVHAKNFVFLGAGSIGTTEIILRSKEHGLTVSPMVGQKMSGNGSMLAFGYDLDERVNSLGKTKPSSDPPGPTISGMIDCRNSESFDESFLIQEGAFPTVMASIFRLVKRLLPIGSSSRRGWLSRCKRFLSGRDALDYSQVYLTLGHDNAVGKMSLHQNVPRLDMSGVVNIKQRENVKSVLARMINALGGTFKGDGVKACVHPLGGMAMSSDGTGRSGATSHTGEVFSGKDTAVHSGLVVVDGALVPRSLGTNPVAMITALAERAVDLAATRSRLTIDFDTKKSFERIYPDYVEKRLNDIKFTETMRGAALVDGEQCPLTLTMHIVIRKKGDEYVGDVTGYAQCPLLSSNILRIQKGTFKPFQQDTQTSMTWNMFYDLDLLGSSRETTHFEGVKTITPSIAFSPFEAWRAATNMRVVLRSDDQIGTASIKLGAADFLRQLRSFKTNRYKYLLAFLSTFIAQEAKFMFIPFAPLQYPPRNCQLTPWIEMKPKPQPASTQTVTAPDNFQTPLRMYEPTSTPNGEDILFIPGGAVTHEIFALSTIRQNAIEHFTARGYRCWIVTHRAATVDRSTSQESWTAFDARLDVAAALEFVYAHRKETPVLIVAHCAGTVALASGLLDGTIPSHLISGIIASQTFLTPLYAPINELKARLGLVKIYRRIVGDWYDCHSTPSDTFIQRLINRVLRFYPQTSRSELCNSSICQRTQLPYGRLWDHANLNEATHSRLHEIFSGTSADGIEHLANMGVKGVITDGSGRNLVTDDKLECLGGIPVFLLSGGASQVFRPEATLRTQQLLNEKFGVGAARRRVFPGLGHLDCWMSNTCAKPGSVFETVADELDIMIARRGEVIDRQGA